MKVVLYIIAGLAAILVLVVLILPVWLLFTQPLPANNWLVGLRDVSIIYASLFMCVGALLFVGLNAGLFALVLLIRNRIAPALEKADDTMQTVKGTATFVSESVVAPIIKVAGAAAGTRAAVQTLLRQRPPKSNGSSGSNGSNGKEQKS